MNYILQTDGFACKLITLLNACIDYRGYNPIPYYSKRFDTISKAFDDQLNNPNKVYNRAELAPAYREILREIRAYKIPGPTSKKQLPKFIRETLQNGGYIDVVHYVYNMHSSLIADYYSDYDTYKIVNGNIFHHSQIVEVLPLPIILKGHTRTNHTFTYWSEKEGVDVINMKTSAIWFY